ncbi:iron-sulfur cluster repair di-iron protein [Myroides sp. JBRI-B21084]|uniref:iron-sulfur cluster repair di-iron protein n=1 Tax=Myroides sp. JBRI-B21084 TaxID=3119977 RepID=UPI0026E3485F|nr:iron-sulfur cluster repair di-iron protein [Paenimyroides cloacae]WKW46515.1 iron-sulfur cluster repair di-iron protein [Paenimyroides cloacae]
MENLYTYAIGDIVTKNFKTAAVFKKYGIDFCCKGNLVLGDVIESKQINASQLVNDLEVALLENNNNADYTNWPLDLLVDYVEKIHHTYVNEKTETIQIFLEKLCSVHGGKHPELYEISELFNCSAQDLAAHMKKEELILFPFVKKMVEAKRKNIALQMPHFGTVENPIEMMKHEHVAEGERFEKIAALTNNYQVPADGCNTYKVTYQMLQDFENDLHTHIHIENNILFKKALKLETEFAVV